MKLRSFLAVALATGLCALAGVRLLRTPDAAGSGPDPAGLPATGTPDDESGGELPAPRAGTERASVAMPGIQIERERMGSASVVGLATSDFRLRSATYFAPDAQQAGVAWQADVGFPALLWSDRARATPITSAPMGNLRLRSFEPFDIRVGGASAPGVVFCQTPSPCAWIYVIGQTNDEGLLQASGADPTCLFRAVDPGRRMVSTWLPATGPELELTVDAPAVDCIVTTTEGRPISGAMVTVMDAEGHSRDAGVTDEQGRAWLRAVDGAVRWIADCPGFTPAAGSPASPIRLRRGRSVTIEVARQNAGPVATGTLIWNGPLTFRAGVRSGLATIRDVPIESFELQMIEGDRTTATQVPAEVTHHAWLMPDALALNGRIHGLDLPGWTLALHLEGAGPRPPVFPGQDGMFRFDNVPDQDLFLRVVAILMEPAGLTELELDRFLVHGGRYADLTLGPDSLPSSELRCKVTVPPGHTGPEHMYVVIERDGGRMMVRRVQDIMNGQCTFPRLLPGRYECSLKSLVWDFPVSASIQVEPLRVTFCDFVLPLRPTCTIRPADPAIADGAALGIRPRGSVEWSVKQPKAGDSACTWHGVPPGDYEARWIAPGLSPAIAKLRVEAGPTFVATIPQQPSVACQIRFRGLDWGRCEATLRISTPDGAVLCSIMQGSNSEQWDLDLYEGAFLFEIRRGQETKNTSGLVRSQGGRCELDVMVH